MLSSRDDKDSVNAKSPPVIVAASKHACLSPAFKRNDEAIEIVRETLLNFAVRLRLIPADLGRLKHEPTVSEFVAMATVEEILGLINNQWDPDSPEQEDAADPWGVEGQIVRDSLLSFAQHFALFDACACVKRPCRHTQAPELAPRELIDLLDEEWHDRSGCYNHLASDSDVEHVTRQVERNVRILDACVSRLELSGPALQKWRATRTTRWYREAKRISDHTWKTWLRKMDKNSHVVQALHSARSIAGQLGWSTPDGSDYYEMLCDCFAAILENDIADDEIVAAMYEPLEDVIPLREIRILLD